jgi:hypothetical protein
MHEQACEATGVPPRIAATKNEARMASNG